MQALLSSVTRLATAAAFLFAFSSLHDGANGCVAICQQFSAGVHFTCVLTNATSNNVRCFGRNDYGALGESWNGSFIGAEYAYPMPPKDVNLGGARAEQVSCGTEHTCVLLAGTGGVRCWGADWSSQLGYGNSYGWEPLEPPHATDIEFDTPNIEAVQVAGGAWHTCVLLIDGRVSCFGGNDNGVIGVESQSESNSPPSVNKIYVQMPNNDKVKQICAGQFHSCAISVQGDVACWGSNMFGQLGYANGRADVWNASFEGYVSLTTNSSLKALKIACGTDHTAVLLENGKVKTFGNNFYNQLGYSYVDHVGRDQVPSYYRPENGYEDEFVRLYASNDSIVRDITCGRDFTCVIDSLDHLFCFGLGDDGQLGYGNATTQVGGPYFEQPYEVGAVDVSVESVEVGDQHTCIRYKNSLDMKCFGKGAYGALGSGDTKNLGNDSSSTPNQLPSINLGAAPMPESACTICEWNGFLFNPSRLPPRSPTLSPTSSPTKSPTSSPTPSTTFVATSAPSPSPSQGQAPNESDGRTDAANPGGNADASGGAAITVIAIVASTMTVLLCATVVLLLLRNSISRKKNSASVERRASSSSLWAGTGRAGLSSPRGGGGGGNDRSSKRQSRAMHSNRASKRSSVRLPRSGAVGGATVLSSMGAGASHSEYSDLSRLQNPVSKSLLNYDFAPVPSEQGANASSSSLSSYEMNFAQSQLVADGDSNYADLSKVNELYGTQTMDISSSSSTIAFNSTRAGQGSTYATPYLAVGGNAAASGGAGQGGDYDMMELSAAPSEANESAAAVSVQPTASAASESGGGGGGSGGDGGASNYQIMKANYYAPSAAETAESLEYTNILIKDGTGDGERTQYDPMPGNA